MPLDDLEIRPEKAADLAAIRRVNLSAFAGPAEAELVDRLRQAGGLTLSLVAVRQGRVVGHIAFSPVTVSGPDQRVSGIGLGPMAVAPQLQRTGIGSSLVAAGLEQLQRLQHPFVVVLGHPEYYPRFGFVPAVRFGIRWEQLVTEEAFLVRELTPGGLVGVSGEVRYRPEFDGV